MFDVSGLIWFLMAVLSRVEYTYPVGIYQLKVNRRNTRTSCEICLKLTNKTPERRLVSLLLLLNIFHTLF